MATSSGWSRINECVLSTGVAVRGHGQQNRGTDREAPLTEPEVGVAATHITVRAAILPCLNLDASLAFYRDALGFELLQETGRQGRLGVTVGPAGQARMSVVLMPPPTDPGIILAASDLDGTFEWLEAGGVEVAQEPLARLNGARDCAFFDPAGNLIRIEELR